VTADGVARALVCGCGRTIREFNVARMPKYEKLRNKRERTSQRLSLANAPKRNIILAIINSAFFIWCISALFLTLGGGYVTNHQQCMREADQIIERRKVVSQEMFGRQLAFSTALENATTLQKLPSGPTIAGSTLPEFSKMSYLDVQMELLKMGNRFAYEVLPDSSIHNAQLAWSEFNDQQADRLFDEFQKPLDQKPTKIDPNLELRSRKLYSQLFNDFASFQHDLDAYAYYFQPDCTPLKTLEVALGDKPQIVLASVSPLFENGDIKSIFFEAIDRFNKLKSDVLALNNAKPIGK
jgi:hypothetical protein